LDRKTPHGGWQRSPIFATMQGWRMVDQEGGSYFLAGTGVYDDDKPSAWLSGTISRFAPFPRGASL
jgi:hypothetical protein